MKNFIIKKETWYKGELTITFKYNLLYLLYLLLLPFFLVYWLGLGVAWLLKQLGKGLKAFWMWLWPLLKKFGLWLAAILLMLLPMFKKFFTWLGHILKRFGLWLGTLISAFWMWLKSLFARKPKQKKDEPAEKKEKKNWWLWLLLLLLALLLLGLLRECSCSGNKVTPVEVSETTEYRLAWNDVMVYRIHLDTLRHDASLIGLKTRGLKKASEEEYNGDAISESEEVLNNEWLPLCEEQIRTKLNRSQKAAAMLYAMRSGSYGFKKSDFLKSVNAGDFAKASEDILKIHKANGEVRNAGKELTAYLYEIRLIWDGMLSAEEVMDCHRLSYKAYPVENGYNPEALKQVILTACKQNATPRELLSK